MKPIPLGLGLAPAVTIFGGWVYVAYGVQPDALIVVTLTTAGTEVRRDVISDGFFNSFPRFSGPWLVYKRNHDWRAAARHVQTGRFLMYRGQADGNFGVVVNAHLNLVAYQWTSSYEIWLGSLLDGDDAPTSMRGAPDGLDVLVDPSRVTLRKDVRTSVPGLLWPVRAGDLVVGELPDLSPGAPPRGAAVQLDGWPLRVALDGQDTPTPSNATDGETYAIVTGGSQGVRLLLGTRDDILALPVAAPTDREPGPVVQVSPAAAPPAAVPGDSAPVPAPADPVRPHHPGPASSPGTTSKEHEMIAYASPVAGFLPGDLVDNGNGTVSVRKPNGQFLCVTPEGHVEERPNGGGLWESFRQGTSSLIAERDGGAAGPKVYVLPIAV